MMRSRNLVLPLFLALPLVLAGCGGPRTPVPEVEPPRVVQSDYGPHLTLAGLIRNALEEQYSFSWDSLLTPPPEPLAEDFVLRLSMEPARPYLLKDVVGYVADRQGLAVALENGMIQAFSDWPCSGLGAPEPAALLAWHAESPVLAAVQEDRRTLRVHDLRLCGQILEQRMEAKATLLALSRLGAYMAVIDEVHGLYIGKSSQPLERSALMRYDALAMSFTPQEGVLMVVDQAGWLTLWPSDPPPPARPKVGAENATVESKPRVEVLDRFLIPGGPYAEARFHGRYLFLTDRLGHKRVLDVVERKPAEGVSEPGDDFSLRRGVLSFQGQVLAPTRRMLLGAPKLAAAVSRELGLLRVDDLDGRERYYALDDGLPVEEPVSAAAGAWASATVETDGGVVVDGRRYVLADIVKQDGRLALFCRFLPESGYHVWWKILDEQREFQLPEGFLPRRVGVNAGAAAPLAPFPDNEQPTTTPKETVHP